jgi:formylglycine-generating enzyme required for sulfatase activity
LAIRYLAGAAGRLGALLLALSLIGGCGRANPVAPPEQPATRMEPTRAPTPTPTPGQGEPRTRPTDGMVTVYVPGGSFQMGSTESQVDEAIALCRKHYAICNRWYYMREHPQHPVSLAGFWLDQTEVTNGQYRRCVEAGMCEEPTVCRKGTPTYADPDKSDHPVVCVSWQDARTYCQWAGARMPTEAEWEYASRGEQGHIFPWGNLFEGARLNYCDTNCEAAHADIQYDDGFAKTSPVGSYPQGASWTGALGMGGNVSEWVGDWLGPYTPEAASNPTGPLEGTDKLVKGCSWFFHPTYCRGATRAAVDPETRFDYLGFRCAASPGE